MVNGIGVIGWGVGGIEAETVMLVVAYALAGRVDINLMEEPLDYDPNGNPDPMTDIRNAHVLLFLGDSVTTDHISPAGSFREESAAGHYLKAHGVEARLDSAIEIEYYRNNGILQYVLRNYLKNS